MLFLEKKKIKIYQIYKKNRILFVGFVLFILLLIINFILPLFCLSKNDSMKSFKSFLEPSKKHLMGTDCLGHDLFEYVTKGTKISLFISFSTVLISGIIGIFLGILAGYFGGFFNFLVNFICDFIFVFPDFILAFLIILFCGKSFYSLILAISIGYIPTFTKDVKSVTMQISQKDFVKSAVCLGASNFYIIRKHIFPHLLNSLIIRISLSLSSIILVASSFGFIGLGLDPSIPEWGSLLSTNKAYISVFPRLFFFPMFIILLTNLSFNFIAEGLSEYLSYKSDENK